MNLRISACRFFNTCVEGLGFPKPRPSHGYACNAEIAATYASQQENRRELSAAYHVGCFLVAQAQRVGKLVRRSTDDVEEGSHGE